MHLILLSSRTNDTFDMGQEYKRYKNRSKMGVETPKGIFYFKMPNCIKAKMVINANPRMIKIMPTPIFSRFSDFVQSLLGLIFLKGIWYASCNETRRCLNSRTVPIIS